MKIFKYEVKIGRQEVRIPKYHKILHFNEQAGKLYIWAKVDDLSSDVSVAVDVVGTGWDVPDDLNYLGTTMTDGYYIWHCFV